MNYFVDNMQVPVANTAKQKVLSNKKYINWLKQQWVIKTVYGQPKDNDHFVLHVQGDFFHWAPPELAKSWLVSN